MDIGETENGTNSCKTVIFGEIENGVREIEHGMREIKHGVGVK